MNNRYVMTSMAASLLVILLLGSLGQMAAAKKAAAKVNGEQVFNQLCASCHTGGGNKVNPSKPIAGSEKLKSLVTFKDYLRNPMGHMPYYKHVVSDTKTLEALYKYCKELTPGQQSLAPLKDNQAS